MTIQYGNAAYFFYPTVIVAFTAVLYLALRNRGEHTKICAVLFLMLLNLAQHLLKRYIYPQYRDHFDIRVSTAYNLCALLILAAPFVFVGKNKLVKDFLVLFGTNGGVVTMLFPYWYIDQPLWQWDVFRFYLCHGFLFASSLLIALLNLRRPDPRNAFRLPLIFFGALILISFNDIVLFVLRGAEGDLFATLSSYNPCWLYRPAPQFERILPLIRLLSPDLFLGDFATGKPFVPLLWYFVPMYLLIALLSFLIGTWCKKTVRRTPFPTPREK